MPASLGFFCFILSSAACSALAPVAVDGVEAVVAVGDAVACCALCVAASLAFACSSPAAFCLSNSAYWARTLETKSAAS